MEDTKRMTFDYKENVQMREPLPKLRLVINFLLMLEVLLGIAIILVAACYQSILGSFMVQVDRKMLAAKFFNTYLLGFQLIASYICSVSMWRRVWKRRYSQTIEILLSVWLFFCFLIVLCGMGTVWSLVNSSDALENTAEIMLFYGIDLYYMMPEWKLLWDQLQYSQECCGVHGYEDWAHANWMPKEYSSLGQGRFGTTIPSRTKRSIDNYAAYDYDQCEEVPTECTEPTVTTTPAPRPTTTAQPAQCATTIQAAQESNEGQTLAPYACCKRESTSCYQNYMPRSENSPIPHLNLTDINVGGCLAVFSTYMYLMLNILLVLMLIAIAVDYLMFVSAKNCHLDNKEPYYDDAGNALVIVRCPPNVKCITMEEQASRFSSDEYNTFVDLDVNNCCCENPSTTNLAGENARNSRKQGNYILH
uniref:Tetraspanin n=1 Tax=Glossina austeni TaxID=7395 RepID=A0A1A9UW27_GLOAU